MTEEIKSLAKIETALTDSEFKKKHANLASFVKNQLRKANDISKGDSGDYGIIPYTKKMSLLKPGAEKLLKLFGFSAHYEIVKEVEDWDHRFVLYKYRCVITHTATGVFIADAVRSCNNKEKKHSSKDVYDVANTIESVAQKRALVAATVQATMASEIFDADTGEYESDAPNKKVTEDEDPRRIRLMGSLYAAADDHGWTNATIHTAIKKKWSVESLTNISNEQIEELTEFILTRYKKVAKGEKPQLIESNPSVVSTPVEEVKEPEQPEPGIESTPVEGEVVDEESKPQNCRNKEKHGDEQVLVPADAKNPYFCNDECENQYWGSSKKTSKFDEFLQKGRQNKDAEEAVTT